MGKKDFEGKNKNKDTYDKDWVLKKVKGPNGTSSMAWVTKKQAKQMKSGEKEAKAYLAQIHGGAKNPPGAPTTTPPATAPILTTPPATAPVVTPPAPPAAPPLTPPATTPTPTAEGTVAPVPLPGGTAANPTPPSWWINAAITNPQTEEHKFANMANAILPTLAPEDQRTLATYLAQNYKDVYGGYANTQFGEAPTELNAEWRKAFLNPQRAQLAVSLLDKMKTASGGGDMGAGYDFLKNAVNVMNQFTTGGVMTREKFAQFQSAVANLGKNASGNLSAYGNLAQLFNMPSFSAGPLVSNEANNKLFS
jgi:hypothetical protein